MAAGTPRDIIIDKAMKGLTFPRKWFIIKKKKCIHIGVNLLISIKSQSPLSGPITLQYGTFVVLIWLAYVQTQEQGDLTKQRSDTPRSPSVFYQGRI